MLIEIFVIIISALAGRGKPGGSGFYDSNNKWVRTSKINEEDPTNRFSIGEAFLVKKENNTETVIVPESVLQKPPPPPPPIETFPEIKHEPLNQSGGSNSGNLFDLSSDDLIETQSLQSPSQLLKSPVDVACEVAHIQTVKVPATDLSKYCEICDISVTSEMHMRLHLSGAKHAKKLRQLGEPPYTEAPHTISQCISDETPIPRPKSSIVGSGASAIDYSVFRTPSGSYYCQVCRLNL